MKNSNDATDAARYRKLRDIAVVHRSLEAEVCLKTLDFVRSNEEFDESVDEIITQYEAKGEK